MMSSGCNGRLNISLSSSLEGSLLVWYTIWASVLPFQDYEVTYGQ
jgi:hypothetical protein